jgi:hypothetical protein
VPLSAKSLSKREQERVREALRELRAKYPTQTDLARALPLRMSQQTISKAMGAGGPIGVKLARAVAKACGQELEELLGGRPAARMYGDVAGWTAAAAEALQHGESAAAVAAVARWPASIQVVKAEWRFVADLAALWRRWAPAEEREDEETADAQREAEADAPGPARGSTVTSRRGRKLS